MEQQTHASDSPTSQHQWIDHRIHEAINASLVPLQAQLAVLTQHLANSTTSPQAQESSDARFRCERRVRAYSALTPAALATVEWELQQGETLTKSAEVQWLPEELRRLGKADERQARA
jgi:hypothetical protein